MNNLFTASTPQDWLISGVILLALGVGFLVFSKSLDKTGGTGKGRITGNQAQRTKSSGYLMLVVGALLAGYGICGILGVFH